MNRNPKLLILLFLFVALFISFPRFVLANEDPTNLKDARDITSPAVAPGPEAPQENPHGAYQNNTNACKDCHSVHTGQSDQLLNENTEEQTCYLCHDGRGSKYDAKNGKTFDENTGFVTDSVPIA